ncbi:hypothetical protein L1049_014688 [Liquidambar formosana]|uniref:Reticulon-like protein n=1 Tax=Liquidambar formosana TaxID=63359 RepID=A0AAP0X5L0_LIQFO
MSTGRSKSVTDGDMQVVAAVAPEKPKPALPPLPLSSARSNALVEYVPPVQKEEEEDLEVKLRRIIENVPVRVSNTSGSSAGSGSGDFHQYRQMRRKEQDRLARMDADYQRRKEEAEFNTRREERIKAAEERTSKKRLKRLKKKQRKKEKKSKLNSGGEEHQKEESSDDEGCSDSVADLLLWKRWCGGVVALVSATALWFLFERAGYNLLSFFANVLLLLVVILFFWAKSASLLNRPLPPLPDLEVSEETVVKAADVMRVWINYGLSVARDIVVGRNIKLLLQVAFGLWVVSYIGSLFNFLTLVYIGVLLSFSIPVLYDKYQNQIDDKLRVTNRVIQTQYRKIDDTILRKIPMPLNKAKKTQ